MKNKQKLADGSRAGIVEHLSTDMVDIGLIIDNKSNPIAGATVLGEQDAVIDRAADNEATQDTADPGIPPIPLTDSHNPSIIFRSHPHIFDAILSFCNRDSLSRLLRCSKIIYNTVNVLLYTDIRVTSDRYHRIFTGATARREFKPKLQSLGYTRTISVFPTHPIPNFSWPETPPLRDYKSVDGLLPSLKSLSWHACEDLPRLARVVSLDHLVLRDAGKYIPSDQTDVTILMDRPYCYDYAQRSSGYDPRRVDRPSNRTLTIVYIPPIPGTHTIHNDHSQESWRCSMSRFCRVHCAKSGSKLRFVGFEMMRELPCENSTDPQQWRPWEDGITMSTQLSQALDGYPAGVLVLDRTHVRAMEDKMQEMTYAEWMPEGRKLGVLTLEEQEVMLKTEKNMLARRAGIE